ncbi:MAG: sulfotransferase family protein [bacterium]
MISSFKVVALLNSVFGFRIKHLGILIFRTIFTCFTCAALCLDRILFPKLKKKRGNKSLFLIGHLRSGTTFMHRYLSELLPNYRSMLLWEMVFPAISARIALKPFLPFMKKVSLGKVWDPSIHKTGFFEPETDDIALSMRYFDGLLSWIYFHAWKEYKTDEEFENALKSVVEKDSFVDYLAGVYARNIYFGKQNLFSKSFCMLFNIDTVRDRFPKAKFILITRDPVESVTSMLSLEKSVQKNLNNIDTQPENLQKRYYRNLYLTSLIYYKKFCEEVKKNSDDILVVSYPELFSDFEGTMLKALSFLGETPTEEALKSIKTQSEKQKIFSSKHRYSPEEFGFTAEEIKKDFSFVYEQFRV